MGRTRTRIVQGDSTGVSTRRIDYVKDIATVSESSSGSYYQSVLSETITDVVVPQFKKRSAQGEIFNNPMQRVSVEEYDAVGTYVDTALSYRLAWNSNDPTDDIPLVKTGYEIIREVALRDLVPTFTLSTKPNIDIMRLSQLAVTKAYANIENSKANMLATAAEGRKTINGFVDIFKRVWKIYRAVRKGNVKYLRKQISAKELANRYMEWRYGIRPCIYDAKQILDAVTNPQKTSDRFTYRGFESESASLNPVERKLLTKAIGYKIYRYLYGQYTCTRKVDVSAGVMCKIDNVSAANNYGLDQPIETMWELVPFSFIADWFFNIGQTIASFTPESGVTQLASWCTVRDSVSHVLTPTRTETVLYYEPDPRYPDVYTLSYTGGQRSRIETTYTRVADPQRSFWPTCKVKLDPSKLLDLAIIIKNLASKDRKNKKIQKISRLATRR